MPYSYFYSSADHLNLHSFPTRRSSDLPWVSDARRTGSPSRRRSRGPAESCRCKHTSAARKCALRSEEHTSELQSHVNLVCRLLLEKKNNRPRRYLSDLVKCLKSSFISF